jgi:hypothetical protein
LYIIPAGINAVVLHRASSSMKGSHSIATVAEYSMF